MMDEYWGNNWHSARHLREQINKLREQASAVRVESAGDLRSVLQSIDQLEVDIGRALLKVHAVVDLLVDKGVLDASELQGKAKELDSLDGEEDGCLHPSLFRTSEERERTPSFKQYLHELEKQPTPSPSAFLKGLEDQQS